MKRLNIRSIAIPPLGCGNGRLNWDDVRPRIEGAFAELTNVDVRLFAPAPLTSGVRELTPEAEKPKMTAGRAAIIKVMSIYRETLYALSQIEVQKLTYFLVHAGQDLGGLQFVKHNYGPYVPALRHVLTKMDGAYLRGVGDGSRPSEITIIPSALEDAEEFLGSHKHDRTGDRVQRVARLIEGFESLYGMELLATVHWAAANPDAASTFDEVVSCVHGWNVRKRQIMTSAHIR